MKGMYSCKQVSQIVSESLDKKLPFLTRVQLWMHLGMCGLCARFRKNMIRVDQSAKNYAKDLERDVNSDGPELSEESRERLKSALESSGL